LDEFSLQDPARRRDRSPGPGVDGIAEATGDAALLNGPKVDGESGHASQDDIDALFN